MSGSQAKAPIKNGYGDECVVRTISGRSLHTAVYPNEVDYVRVVGPDGQEIAYWSQDEWAEQPNEVMGAIIGALRPGKCGVEDALREFVRTVEQSGGIPRGDLGHAYAVACRALRREAMTFGTDEAQENGADEDRGPPTPRG